MHDGGVVRGGVGDGGGGGEAVEHVHVGLPRDGLSEEERPASGVRHRARHYPHLPPPPLPHP